jgi:hypothetical protein
VIHNRGQVDPPARAAAFDWLVEVGFKPGVTDNVGRTARTWWWRMCWAARWARYEEVYTATQYFLRGTLDRAVERLGRGPAGQSADPDRARLHGAEWARRPARRSVPASATRAPQVRTYRPLRLR